MNQGTTAALLGMAEIHSVPPRVETHQRTQTAVDRTLA
jgi:hypothetical protein